MASGRFVSTSIAEDDKLSRLSMTAELIYLKTIPHLDRDGMISGKPGLLFSKVCPLREELFGETRALIDEWVNVGLVIRFACDEGPVLFFPGFAKNNNLPHYERERPSRFPAPPGYYRAEKGILKNGTTPPVKKPKADPDMPPQDDTGIQDEVLDIVQEFVLQEQEEEEDQDQVKEKAAGGAAPAAAVDPNVARVWKAWDANMPGTKTPIMVDAVNGLIDEYSAAEIEEAIGIACKRQRRSFDYVQGILRKGVFSDKPQPSGGDYRPPPGAASRNRGLAAATAYMQQKGMLNGHN